MEPEGLNHEERVSLFDAVYRIVGQVEKRFDSLRDTDREAVKLAHGELSSRLEGFPQQYATKIEMEQAALALRRLENTSLSREVYDQQQEVVDGKVNELERDKLDRSVFDTFVENYRIDQVQAGIERRNVAEVLANATNQVRDQIISERGDFLTQEVYDQRHQALVQQVDAVERWQYKLVGGLVFATFVAPLVTGLIVYFFTQRL
jgi:membrane-associated HD superfamily phosphohydrolase